MLQGPHNNTTVIIFNTELCETDEVVLGEGVYVSISIKNWTEHDNNDSVKGIVMWKKGPALKHRLEMER